MRTAIAALAVASICSCSWLMITPPPHSDPGTRPVACSDSRVVPAADTLTAIGLAALATGFAWGFEADGEPPSTGHIVAIEAPILVAAGAFAWSAVHGFRSTGRCREINASSPAPERASAVSDRDR